VCGTAEQYTLPNNIHAGYDINWDAVVSGAGLISFNKTGGKVVVGSIKFGIVSVSVLGSTRLQSRYGLDGGRSKSGRDRQPFMVPVGEGSPSSRKLRVIVRGARN